VRSQIINVGSYAHRSAKLRLDDMHLRNKWSVMGAYTRSKLGVMLWGLDLDRRLRAANSPVVTQLTHPGFVGSNLSSVSDKPFMAALDRVVKKASNVIGNDIDGGAVPTLYCISEPVPPGSYIGYEGVLGLKGPLVMLGRTALAGDYEVAAKLVEFAEKETGTALPV
jgi:NAD(P)-dependent dehydrogenase (short-subunit alcohol dehydrogenase family)